MTRDFQSLSRWVEDAAAQLKDSADEEYGGFGKGVKYPLVHNLLFLIRYANFSGDRAARSICEKAIRQMYYGGLYDHIGGGFFACCGDREWLIPSPVKRLEDNAAMAILCTEAWQKGRMALHRDLAESALDFCLESLRDEYGIFCTELTALPEHYLLMPDWVKQILGEVDGRHFCECYDITPEGNCRGKSIPNLLLNTRRDFLPEGYGDFRERLRLARDAEATGLKKGTPASVGAQGMLLTALAKAGRIFADNRYLTEAEGLSSRMQMMTPASHGAEHSEAGSAVLEGKEVSPLPLRDTCLAALGELELFGADFRPEHLERAVALGIQVGELLAAEAGSAGSVYDGVLPGAAGLAALVFDRLAGWTGSPIWQKLQLNHLQTIHGQVGQFPAGCTSGLCAALDMLNPAIRIVCTGNSPLLPVAAQALTAGYRPELYLIYKHPENQSELERLLPCTAECIIDSDRVRFYSVMEGKASELIF